MNQKEKIFEKYIRDFKSIIPKPRKIDPKKRKIKPCRVKLFGEYLVTSSNKTVWKAKGHAKLALYQHFGRNFEKMIHKLAADCGEKCKIYSTGAQVYAENFHEYRKEFLDFLEKNQIIEFVEVTFEELAEF